jgi:hypothetical protein
MQSGLKQRQGGATFLGMVTIVAILGLALYAGIRLVPLYLDHMAVLKALKDISTSLEGSATPQSIRAALSQRWTVDYIASVNSTDIEITPVPEGLEMRAAYDARAPFVGNIYFVVEFDDAVTVSGRGQ